MPLEGLCDHLRYLDGPPRRPTQLQQMFTVYRRIGTCYLALRRSQPPRANARPSRIPAIALTS
jgi:hypothetical protein